MTRKTDMHARYDDVGMLQRSRNAHFYFPPTPYLPAYPPRHLYFAPHRHLPPMDVRPHRFLY